MLACKDGRHVRLISRNAVDHTRRFPELAAAIAKLRADVVVLDGEVAVYDDKLEGVFYVGEVRDADAFDGALVGDSLEYRGVVEFGFRASDGSYARRVRRRGTRHSPIFGRCMERCGSKRGCARRSATLK